MIRHVVMINFRHGVPESARHLCVATLRELANLVPGLANWRSAPRAAVLWYSAGPSLIRWLQSAAQVTRTQEE
jgi:hypothetical protein